MIQCSYVAVSPSVSNIRIHDIPFYVECMKHPTFIVFIIDKVIELKLVASTRNDYKWISYHSDVIFAGTRMFVPKLAATNNKDIIEAPYHWPFVNGMHHSLVNSNKKRPIVSERFHVMKSGYCNSGCKNEHPLYGVGFHLYCFSTSFELGTHSLLCFDEVLSPFVDIPVMHWNKYFKATHCMLGKNVIAQILTK